MAFKTPRTAVGWPRQALKHYKNTNAPSVASSPLAPIATTNPKSFSTSAPRHESLESESDRPRWSYTPPRMKAPFSPHITRFPMRSVWKVNEDPEKLDQALNSFLGRDGHRMLPEELKFLAVTHKSFDQGRRGFNDRLAFLGRQICALEATQLIVNSAPNPDNATADPYADMREPYQDPALRSLDNLTSTQPSDIFDREKLAKLAVDTGLSEVVRWKPRMPENLSGSGLSTVLSSTIYAIVGAIALQNGGKAAHKIVQDRILRIIHPSS
ncbi:RNase III domain-containing protein [Xylariaceae sp. FL0594]|nr:RNase III domain-containing protein [Xylariaceae sp. FL0594]